MINKLIQIIREHGFSASISDSEGKIIVRGCEPWAETEEIPATVQAVRDWLGY